MWLAALLALGWLGYAVWGRRWRIEPVLHPARNDDHGLVVAVVPARDEAGELPATLPCLLHQTYPNLRVVLVDDHSNDGTTEVAQRLARECRAEARLLVLRGAELPAGWMGKVWAQQQGYERAIELGAHWIWFTDADIRHDADVLAGLLATAADRQRDFVSVMARLRCQTLFEKLLIPAFTYFFAALYPFRLIGDDRSVQAGAAGGCMLVNRELLARIGGLTSICDAVIDDVSLGDVCKRAGGRLWLGYAHGVNSTRGYSTLRPIWDMVARSAYTQLYYNPAALLGCVVGLGIVFLLPFVLFLCGTGWSAFWGFLAYAGMAWTYLPMLRHLGCHRSWALTLPLAAALYTAMTVSSAWRYYRGTRTRWKGRVYDA